MIRALLSALIRLYQRAISPWLGPVCRFEPSCSRYALACIETHGALRGSLLSLLRLCKCHPFHPGGIDLPPPKGAPLFPLARRAIGHQHPSTAIASARRAPRPVPQDCAEILNG